jgi:hypothetical protein
MLMRLRLVRALGQGLARRCRLGRAGKEKKLIFARAASVMLAAFAI